MNLYDIVKITTAKLAIDVQNALVPVGAVQAFATNSTPSGWLYADGSDVSRTTYADLFAKIGTTYGAGNGTTTFGIPDLRGIFVRGIGSQTIGGVTYSGTLATQQQDAMQRIQGEINVNPNAGLNISSFSGAFFTDGADTSTQVAFGVGTVEGVYKFDSALVTRTATETRPANIALRYCIKF